MSSISDHDPSSGTVPPACPGIRLPAALLVILAHPALVEESGIDLEEIMAEITETLRGVILTDEQLLAREQLKKEQKG